MWPLGALRVRSAGDAGNPAIVVPSPPIRDKVLVEGTPRLAPAATRIAAGLPFKNPKAVGSVLNPLTASGESVAAKMPSGNFTEPAVLARNEPPTLSAAVDPKIHPAGLISHR